MVLLITYDLNKAKDYTALYEAIKSLGDWRRDSGLDSVWFVSTSLAPFQVRDRLLQVMDSDDTLFVTRLRSGEYDGWMSKLTWTWIQGRV